MKNSEIVELSTEDIAAKIVDERTALTKLKFAHAVSAIENPNRIRYSRRTIARLLTELTKREKAGKAASAANETAAEA